MKKIGLVLLSSFLMVNIISGQMSSKDEKLKEHIVSLDIGAWNAWKNKDVAFFKANTTETFHSANPWGISNKTEMINTAFVDCNVKSFSLDNIMMIKLNKKAVLLTYIATQDAECAGQKLPAKVRGSVTYVKQGGKWMEAFYMDTPVKE